MGWGINNERRRCKKVWKNEADRIINHIVYLRKKGITQENLAERAAISRSTFGQIEKGAVKISLVTFIAILKGLNVFCSEFFMNLNRKIE